MIVLFVKICGNCKKEFSLKGKTKREQRKRFCSRFCAAQYNGKNNTGKKRTKEVKQKMSESVKGKKNSFYGRTHREETKKLLSQQRFGISWEKKFGKEKANLLKKQHSTMFAGENNPFFGKTHREETKELIAKNHWDASGKNNPMYQKGYLITGSNNPSWLGGISYGEYGLEFNESLKTKIRHRDKFTCVHCKNPGWTVHHIDYDKKNNDELNLITLCNSCHGKTNFNREKWVILFKEAINGK